VIEYSPDSEIDHELSATLDTLLFTCIGLMAVCIRCSITDDSLEAKTICDSCLGNNPTGIDHRRLHRHPGSHYSCSR